MTGRPRRAFLPLAETAKTGHLALHRTHGLPNPRNRIVDPLIRKT